MFVLDFVTNAESTAPSTAGGLNIATLLYIPVCTFKIMSVKPQFVASEI